jgi:hypothetical protein
VGHEVEAAAAVGSPEPLEEVVAGPASHFAGKSANARSFQVATSKLSSRRVGMVVPNADESRARSSATSDGGAVSVAVMWSSVDIVAQPLWLGTVLAVEPSSPYRRGQFRTLRRGRLTAAPTVAVCRRPLPSES